LRSRPITSGERRFLHLDDLIRHSADKLFPGMELIDATMFRILRNAEIELDEEEESLREAVTEALQQRRFQPVVRMDLAPDANPALRQGLMEHFELSDDDVYELPGLLDYTGLFQIAGLDVPALRDPHWSPLPPPRLPSEEVDIFAAIQAGDIAASSSLRKLRHERRGLHQRCRHRSANGGDQDDGVSGRR
jgi:polyphosphate kinase